MTIEEFRDIWNACSSVEDVCMITGQTKQAASVKASRLRKEFGLDLKYMPFKVIMPIVDRFWAMVEKTENCWLWTGSVNRKGYGQISQNRRGLRPLQAHRLSYEIHFGEIPTGLLICHRCDNPSCVRPEHLFAASPKENTDDMVQKERGHWQSNAPHRKAERVLVEL